MEITLQDRFIKVAFVAFVAVVSINIWSFRPIDDSIYRILEVVAVAFIALIVIANSHILVKKGLIFNTHVHLFLWIPFLSIIGAYLYHGQSIELSLLLLRTNFFWLLYFVLHIFNIPKKYIINLLIGVGAVWIFLTIAQQFTYPSYYFYTRNDANKSILRANIYRYMVAGQQYGIFFLLYFFYRFLLTDKITYLLLSFCGLAGFYFYGTRQFALVAVFCMCVAILLLKGRAKWKYVLLFLAAGAVAFLYKDLLFGQYIEMTKSQLESGDNIRFYSGYFFLNEYWPGWGARIIGNGLAHLDSAYGREMFNLNTFMHYYRSDVGIIGIFNQYGIFYVLAIILVTIRGLTVKFATDSDKYLKLFFINAAVLLILHESYSDDKVIPFYCFIFYLIDKSAAPKSMPVIKQEVEKTAGVAMA